MTLGRAARNAGAPPANSTFFCIESACFIYSATTALFSEARRACIALGGSLVKYDQAAKQNQASRNAASGQSRAVQLGLSAAAFHTAAMR